MVRDQWGPQSPHFRDPTTQISGHIDYISSNSWGELFSLKTKNSTGEAKLPETSLELDLKLVMDYSTKQIVNSMFQDSPFKMSFTQKIIYVFVISTLSTKPNWPVISLVLPGNNLENTWNFMSAEKWEPCKWCIYCWCYRSVSSASVATEQHGCCVRLVLKTGQKTIKSKYSHSTMCDQI